MKNNALFNLLIKQAANAEDILGSAGDITSPVLDKLGLDNLSDTGKGVALAAMLAAPAANAVASNRGAANGALQGAVTTGGALAGYNAGRLLADQMENADLDDYLGKGGLQALKYLAMGGGAAAGGYAGHKAGERLWLG